MTMTEKQKQKIAPIVNAYRALNADEKKLFSQALEFFDSFDGTATTPAAAKSRGPGRPPKAKADAPKADAAATTGEFKCGECDKVFPSQHGRAIHMGREHAKKN